ncbi:GNAT family N-acetyltransferase [Streptomyces sp. NPDC054775]
MSLGEAAISDVPERHRYEARIEGEVAGYAAYRRGPKILALVHTVVEGDHQGMGIGSALAKVALDEARAAGLKVIPTCPFIEAWIGRSPEYQDLVYEPNGGMTN